jgi:hypothetical protein
LFQGLQAFVAHVKRFIGRNTWSVEEHAVVERVGRVGLSRYQKFWMGYFRYRKASAIDQRNPPRTHSANLPFVGGVASSVVKAFNTVLDGGV